MKAIRNWTVPPYALLAASLLLGGLVVILVYPKVRSACGIWDTSFARTVLIQPASHLGKQHVRFVVTDRNGAPGVGRAIEYYHSSGSQEATTDTNGVADLQPGEWGVDRIVLDGHVIQESRWTYLFFRPNPLHGLEVRIKIK